MTYKVYALLDDRGCILVVGSSAFLQDPDGWTEIDHGDGDKYHHAQANYLFPLRDVRGIPRYKLVDGEVIERTQDEMDADVKPVSDPRLFERLQALESVVETIKRIADKLSPL